MKARQQLVCCKQGRLACPETSIQLEQGDAGGSVKKAHVMMVNLDFLFDAREKTFTQNMRCVYQHRVACMLVSEADFSRPEPAGPLIVFNRRIEIIDRRVILTLVGERREIPSDLACSLIESLEDSLACDFFHCYPFSPAVATPWTKNFCNARKTMTTGMRATTLAAMISPYSLEYWLMNILRPIWMVFSSILVK